MGLALMLALTAAGLLASSIPRDWLKAVILAKFSPSLLVRMLGAHEEIIKRAILHRNPGPNSDDTTLPRHSTT